MNLWIFDNMAFVVLHVSAPYKSTDFTFELKIFIFVPLEMFLALHTFLRMLKMTLALLSSSSPSHRHNVKSAILFGGGNFRDCRNPIIYRVYR